MKKHLVDLIPEKFKQNWQELQEVKHKRKILFPVVGHIRWKDEKGVEAMKPREELEELILDADSFDRAAKRTRAFAIGRWVSVEERLPDDFGSYMTDLGCAYFDPISNDFSHPYVTKWMDLDLPTQPKRER